ncbi:MAG: hypothetical protein HC858_04030, partial [Brachymonas sp.]|nr:hypothetical protein [Brachymonas sp.]
MDATSPSTKLFSWLARLPLIALPSLLSLWQPGSARLVPILCDDAAAAICRICEHPKALHRAIELAGPQEFSYREFLAELRNAQGFKRALWLPVPWILMGWFAKIAEFFPQKVISADGMRVLKVGITTERNEALYWLRCMPKSVSKAMIPSIECAQSATELVVAKES